MRELNRALLTQFLSDLQQSSMAQACFNFSEISEVNYMQVNERWADDCIDEELRKVLHKSLHGQHLSVDLTAHMDYFFNTRGCDVTSENPFNVPQKYPALLYKVSGSPCQNFSSPAKDIRSTSSGGVTLLMKHQQVIYP